MKSNSKKVRLPYWAHRNSALNVFDDDVQQISGNNFEPFFNLGEEE